MFGVTVSQRSVNMCCDLHLPSNLTEAPFTPFIFSLVMSSISEKNNQKSFSSPFKAGTFLMTISEKSSLYIHYFSDTNIYNVTDKSF